MKFEIPYSFMLCWSVRRLYKHFINPSYRAVRACGRPLLPAALSSCFMLHVSYSLLRNHNPSTKSPGSRFLDLASGVIAFVCAKQNIHVSFLGESWEGLPATHKIRASFSRKLQIRLSDDGILPVHHSLRTWRRSVTVPTDDDVNVEHLFLIYIKNGILNESIMSSTLSYVVQMRSLRRWFHLQNTIFD